MPRLKEFGETFPSWFVFFLLVKARKETEQISDAFSTAAIHALLSNVQNL